ncbi:hypothetical protein CMK10_14290 [Candidatus Poribacteria bacterium]|nr:hypothetical protein [Candidatus Poribacteria bacterium]MEC8840703.1 hypothetical protein [Candidatus Poribacteria bacterium]MEE3193172.1 hypothetical protein [Candidatus Poribacteria bacterium]
MSKCDTSKDKFLTQCLDAKIQALKPENANPDVWIPTFDQLQDLICQNVKKKSDDIWKVNDGIWKCTIIISEWTADYGTFAETERTFTGRDPELVAILALKAAIGVGERLLVGDLPND